MSNITWFSKDQQTLEDAQKAAEPLPPFFAKSGIFKTPAGSFVHANLRLAQWSKSEILEIKEAVLAQTGYTLVAYTDALFGWLLIE